MKTSFLSVLTFVAISALSACSDDSVTDPQDWLPPSGAADRPQNSEVTPAPDVVDGEQPCTAPSGGRLGSKGAGDERVRECVR